MARLDELRLMARVARMYYEGNLKQPEIAERLSLSQATISRLLKRAEAEGIVRITVSVPVGAFPEQEEALERRYGLKEAIVVDSLEDEEEQVMRDLGAAAAYYVETTVRPEEVVGVAAYASLLSMVNAMHPRAARGGAREGVKVVQLTGGVGNPAAEAHATQVTRRLASLLRGEATFLPAPGLAATAEARRMFMQDPFVREAFETFDRVTLALVGIAPLEVRSPGGFMASFTLEERELLARRGAVGFICERFYDAQGTVLATPLDDRLIAIGAEQLRRVDRSVGITGGPRRIHAIRAALAGSWVNVLITDRFTADRLLQS
jgi:DNA-binding transcriptional regulator LsrR (DeoR family)